MVRMVFTRGTNVFFHNNVKILMPTKEISKSIYYMVNKSYYKIILYLNLFSKSKNKKS